VNSDRAIDEWVSQMPKVDAARREMDAVIEELD
jgi:hypothetical protein